MFRKPVPPQVCCTTSAPVISASIISMSLANVKLLPSIRILAKATELDHSILTWSLKPLLKRGLMVDLETPGARNSKLVLT